MEGDNLERVTVAIYGLGEEGGSVLAVQQALLFVPGVHRAYVNAGTEMAYIEYDPARTAHADLLRAIEGAGLQPGEVDVRAVGYLPPFDRMLRSSTAPSRLLDSQPAAEPSIAQGVSAADAHPAVSDQVSAPAIRSGKAIFPAGEFVRWRDRPARMVVVAGLAVLMGALVWLAIAERPVPGKTYTVEARTTGFSPLAVVIPAGQPVTLRVRNADSTSPHASISSHQFAIAELGINVKLQPGQSTIINLPPLPPGTYHYYCNACCSRSSNPAMQGALIIH